MPTYKTAKNVSHIFDCRGQFFLKWEQQSIFPLFQNSSKNWMTFSHPNFNFMGCYTGQGVFFSRRPFFSVSVFSFFSWVHRGAPLLFCYVSFDFCHLRTHRHFRNTKAHNVPGTRNMLHMSVFVNFNTEYFTLDRVEFHEINKYCGISAA